jgi:hypothetical protein
MPVGFGARHGGVTGPAPVLGAHDEEVRKDDALDDAESAAPDRRGRSRHGPAATYPAAPRARPLAA